MKSIFKRYNHFFLLLLILIVSEFIVNPIGDFPLNDDWSYGKSVSLFHLNGKLNIGDFAAMSLFTHLMWGILFTKVFWFSFTVLRFSTLVSCFIGIVFLYKLTLRISENKNLSFFSALIILFNPLYFNLTNTFMTDVNFNTLLILCCYFAFDFFKTQNRSSFFLVFVFSSLLVLIRQFGVIVPVCFTFAILFYDQNKWSNLLLSLVLTAAVLVVFKYYESFLKGYLSPDAAYKFSYNTHVTSAEFWDGFFYNVSLRDTQILMHLVMYAFPLSLIYVNQIVKKFNPLLIFLVLGINTALGYYLFNDVPFPLGNVFSNLSVGAETFYETLYVNLKSPFEHTYSHFFELLFKGLKYLSSTVMFSVFTFMILGGIKQKSNPVKISPVMVFLIAVFFTYTFMLLITVSYFDRYHIPLISLLIIMISFYPDRKNLTLAFASVFLVCMFYLSVFGTKDYLELNRKRWEAYNNLKDKEKINPDKINGGFEVNCWNLGKYNWWYDFVNIDNFEYIIQYRKEPGFKVYKEYAFQRYLPYKRDTLFVYKRGMPTP